LLTWPMSITMQTYTRVVKSQLQLGPEQVIIETCLQMQAQLSYSKGVSDMTYPARTLQCCSLYHCSVLTQSHLSGADVPP
jgi:hypothetical protein